ncbi:MAG: DUF1800 domain-containing protein [Planctomycetaceae bacterium]
MKTSAYVLLLATLASGGASGDPLAPLDPPAFSIEQAAHLLRRAGFGGTREEVAALHARGLAGAIDSLIDWEGKPDPGLPTVGITVTEKPDRSLLRGLSEEERQKAQQDYRRRDGRQLLEIREWWLRAMVKSAFPLRERLTLFWHGHFTSSYRDVRDSYHLFLQNTLLRRHAAGNFAALLHAVSKDPAMLEYLDNRSNRRQNPNENYAREVMELFTMGTGNYTEEDIKEAARAFTGWTFQGNRFVFNRRDHDPGTKTFLWRKGEFDGDDILDIILAQPATARTVATKIFRYFAHDAPSAELSDALGATLRDANYELRPLLRTIFLSKEFYSPRSVGRSIKGPVEFVASLYRSLDLDVPRLPILAGIATSLGQSLFDPPNVKGWDGGREWITTSHLLARYNVAAAVVGLPEDRSRASQGGRRAPPLKQLDGKSRNRPEEGGEMEGAMEGEEMGRMAGSEEERAFEQARRDFAQGRAMSGTYDVAAEVRRLGLSTQESIVDHFTAVLVANPPSPALRASLLATLGGGGPHDPASPQATQRLHALLRMIVSTPEFQLN